jgi:hypothetical protein
LTQPAAFYHERGKDYSSESLPESPKR